MQYRTLSDEEYRDAESRILYEDNHLLVVNKPQGLVVHPCASTRTGTLVNGLLSRVKDLSGINGVLRPGIVHRLDKNTSGLMVVAKNDMAHISLSKQIKDKTCKRKYLALVEGHLKEDSGTIKTFIDRCCSRYTRIQNKEFYYILTAADGNKKALERTVTELGGFLACLDGAVHKGTIFATGVWSKGEVLNTNFVKDAYEMGKSV